MAVNNTCEGCKHCGKDCFCDVLDKKVNPNSKACSDFNER